MSTATPEHHRFAESGANSAGSSSSTALSRDVYESPFPAPITGPDAFSLEWDTYPPRAVGSGIEHAPGSDAKLSRGFGSSAPDVSPRFAAAGPSSLDPITNNRHSETRTHPKRSAIERLMSGDFVNVDTGDVIEIPRCYRRP